MGPTPPIATEIVTLKLKEGSKLESRDTEEGQKFGALYHALIEKEGMDNTWYGRIEERPDEAQMFINWRTIEHHEEFKQQSNYGPTIAGIKSIVAGPPNVVHVNFTYEQSQKIAFGAPITELVTVYVPSTDSPIVGNVQKFGDVLSRDGEGFLGMASGWVVEEVEHEKFNGVKGNAYFLAIGWQSIEDHMAFRQKASYKSNVNLIVEPSKAIEIHHVKMHFGDPQERETPPL